MIWCIFKVGVLKLYVNIGFDWLLGFVGLGDNENVMVLDILLFRKLLFEDMDCNIWLVFLICEVVGVGILLLFLFDEDCWFRLGWFFIVFIMVMEVKLDILDMMLLWCCFFEKECMLCYVLVIVWSNDENCWLWLGNFYNC